MLEDTSFSSAGFKSVLSQAETSRTNGLKYKKNVIGEFLDTVFVFLNSCFPARKRHCVRQHSIVIDVLVCLFMGVLVFFPLQIQLGNVVHWSLMSRRDAPSSCGQGVKSQILLGVNDDFIAFLLRTEEWEVVHLVLYFKNVTFILPFYQVLIF